MAKFISKLLKIIKKPKKIIIYSGSMGLLNWLPDKPYLKLFYWAKTDKILNLENPQTYNEKIQWLKLYDRKFDYSIYADKYAVRSFVADTIGEKYLIPLIGVYNNVEEIEWDTLPDKFVLKCTHGSGSNIICSDKSKLDIKEAKIKLNKWIKKNWYWFGREWCYKNIRPKIICEKFLHEDDNQPRLTDYKLYCFKGIPRYCQVIRGRGKNETIDFYDQDWNHMPFNGLRKLPQSKRSYEKPTKYKNMLKLAEKLSKGFSFIRVDFYLINGDIYFGELTFYPTSGFGKFYPEEWNRKIGDLIKLPYG